MQEISNLPGLEPPPDVEIIECYGEELIALMERLKSENRWVSVMTCDRRHYTCTVNPIPKPSQKPQFQS